MKKYKSKIFTFSFIIFTIIAVVWSFTDEEIKEEKIVNIEKNDIKKEKKNSEKKELKDIEAKVIVDVKGQVNTPGVYELTNMNNVNDAINVAGGLTTRSDTSNINLSKKLSDEMVIIVYSKDEINQMKETKKVECPKINDACICEKDEKAILKTNEEDKSVNINTATKEELMTLDGIGEAKAKAIIEYRQKYGDYKDIEDIKNVSGIGDAAFEKIKDSISV